MKSKMYLRTKDGRELEVLSGSYIYLRDSETKGIYWEWPKISALHDDIERIIENAETSIDQIKSRLGEITEEVIFPAAMAY